MLAESAHAVAILIDSPGTFTELGAFANHEKLQDKLILVIEPKYKKVKSFINLGPVRYLKKRSQSKIHYIPLDIQHIKPIASAITESCRDIAKHSAPVEDLTNPIFAYNFYLSLIHVFDPIPKDALISIGTKLSNCAEDAVIVAAETVVNTLINEGNVSCVSNTLSCTKKGSERLIYSNPTKNSLQIIRKFLTNIRYQVLNELYRGKIGIKGGAF